ncbi:MAG: radical SAM protein [Coriobacteriales bacterium]|jgi:tRNA-2-methylthio-N6-dimethylallyladenosine synthase|nr:radical SAM protein [Coriobacteriales bacterium]
MNSVLTELQGRRFLVRTFGCQMNEHDSERVTGMLEALGAMEVASADAAEIVVFMTCCVREAADERLYGQVASLKNTGCLIAIGGCIGQRDGARLLERLPHVDVVFGTLNIAQLPALLAAALAGEGQQVALSQDGATGETASAGGAAALGDATGGGAAALGGGDLGGSAAALGGATAGGSLATCDLPAHRQHAWHAWLPIMTGCNNFCSYCVVPYVRGREHSRPLEQVVAEAAALVADGVQEITLLGQNVNSYGRDLYGQPRFAEVLRAVGASGVARLRFATSHPKDLTPETIAAFAETPAVMPALHLPVQSGSDKVLAAMNRNYTAEHYLGLIAAVREACAAAGKTGLNAASGAGASAASGSGADGASRAAGLNSAGASAATGSSVTGSNRAALAGPAFSTDIIVGFPGETERDFEATMELVRAVGYSQAFTFIYSKRDGTPAAAMDDDTPREVLQERFDRLVELVQQSAWQQNQQELGQVVPVLFEGVSKRDARMLSGRSPKNQTVHAPLPDGTSAADFSGRILNVRVTQARTWYLRGELCQQ